MKKYNTQYNEIRLSKGKPDDIVIYNVHLERMTGNHWWLGIYKGKERTCFGIKSKSPIEVETIENELDTQIIK